MAQIKKDTSLRKAILQAAITGQLVSNVEGESLPLAPASKLSSATPSAGASPATSTETGKELLDRIIEERNNKLLAEWEDALKKNPKTKKPAPVVASEIDEEEIPFEIPENWCWCRLGDICEFENGDRSSKYPVEKDYVPDGIPFFGAKDIEQRILSFSNVRFISKEKFDSLGNGKLKNQDFICLLRGSVGKIAQFIESEKYKTGFICAQMLIIRALSIPSFISFLMETPYITEDIESKITGTAVRQLPALEVKNLLIPLPPLAVQNAIVAKLEQVLPLVDAYENAILQKEELKSALPDKVKKAILQEAITGKLTEAWRKTKWVAEPAEAKESGKQLLDRIIEERNAKALAEWEEALKKNPKAKKPAPIIASLQYDQDGRLLSEVEVPFEVPESWCWCRLGDLFITSSGTTPASKNPDYYVNGTINWVRTTDLNNDVLTSTEIKITEKAKEDCNLRIIPQDSVCIALYGGVGTIGKNALIKFDTTINQSVCAIHPNGFCSMKYIQWFMQWQRPNWMELASGSRKDPNINQIIVKNCLIPLPPLAEQEEIVKKVEELLPLCK